jgi:hypothetical protein
MAWVILRVTPCMTGSFQRYAAQARLIEAGFQC